MDDSPIDIIVNQDSGNYCECCEMFYLWQTGKTREELIRWLSGLAKYEHIWSDDAAYNDVPAQYTDYEDIKAYLRQRGPEAEHNVPFGTVAYSVSNQNGDIAVGRDENQNLVLQEDAYPDPGYRLVGRADLNQAHNPRLRGSMYVGGGAIMGDPEEGDLEIHARLFELKLDGETFFTNNLQTDATECCEHTPPCRLYTECERLESGLPPRKWTIRGYVDFPDTTQEPSLRGGQLPREEDDEVQSR